MQAGVFAFILAMFALAGFVKGVIGLGLPTISMGLLVLVMRPVEAAAVLVLQTLRSRLPPLIFRRCFFDGLLLLGLYLIIGVVR